MSVVKNTISFCPECYKRIPATVVIRNGSVWIEKNCSEHGFFCAMVERDVDFYLKCLNSGNGRIIYNGYSLEVTDRCNLSCAFCYYPKDNSSKDRSIENIMQEVDMVGHLGPILVTGGEPTVRKDLLEVIATIQMHCPNVELITNGVNIDEKMLDKLIPLLSSGNSTVRINMSLHKEAQGKDIELLELCRKKRIKLESVLIEPVSSLDQIEAKFDFAKEYADTTVAYRMRAATNIWNEKGVKDKIFVSDMLKELEKYGMVHPIWWRNNKTSFFNTLVGGIPFMLISWYDVNNCDILDINCPPLYPARNGTIENAAIASIVNEGMDKGWLNGRRIKD